MTGVTRVDVCVCTFRRPAVAATLASIAAQRDPSLDLRVVVADNDETDAARPSIEAAARREGLRLVYVHAPARNISIARNAALGAASARWVALIDDDETADPGWLAALLQTAEETGAGVVFGPVAAVYRADAPRWMRDGDFHSTAPVMRGGTIRTGATCNALLDTTCPALRGQRFRLELGRTGGEDTEFFARVFRRGGRLAFAPSARVREPVPPERASLRWLVRRRFRSGQSHALLLDEESGGSRDRTPALLLASAKCGFCLVAAAAVVVFSRRRAFWILRAALHAGVVSGIAGARTLTMYGGSDPVPEGERRSPPAAPTRFPRRVSAAAPEEQ